jgi:hypothetical protein
MKKPDLGKGRAFLLHGPRTMTYAHACQACSPRARGAAPSWLRRTLTCACAGYVDTKVGHRVTRIRASGRM